MAQDDSESNRMTPKYDALFNDPDDRESTRLFTPRTSTEAPFLWAVPLRLSDTNAPGFAGHFTPITDGSAYFPGYQMTQMITRLAHEPVRIQAETICMEKTWRTVYLVGLSSTMMANAARFRRWVSRLPLESRFPTYFQECFLRSVQDPVQWEHQNIRAWLSINDDVGWTLDATVAERLQEAFGAGSVSR